MNNPPERRLDEEPPPLVAIHTYRKASRAHEHGLVILSMGVPYWLMPLDEGGFGLFIEEKHLESVTEQLNRFDNENRYWPPPSDYLPTVADSWKSVLFYLLLIWGIFIVQTPELLSYGSASSEAIDNGEWWRTVTALTLHGDWGHLIGNSFGGLLFFPFILRYFGRGIGWLTILLSGIGGNILNALIYSGSSHNSIGASTAVFGGLGLLIGFRTIRQYRTTGLRWPRELLLPILGGTVLLGYLGSGGETTDILAHLWGFVVGGTIGIAISLFYPKIDKSPVGLQLTAAWATIGLLIWAWLLALP